MVKSILITICLANDMISPVEKNQALPNNLHIGYYETTRLLGHNWEKGPLLSFVKTSYKNSNKLAIIHVRDWHDPSDPLQEKELLKYGHHCIKDTWGAQFVWESKKLLPENKNAFVINSKKILTATEPEFSKLMKKLIGDTPKEEIKIGIIGVLTNIKVAQMAIALQGIYDLDNIAVCSELTASNNIRKHFQGLDDLSNIYGVKVFNSIKQFGDWLNIKSEIRNEIGKFDVPLINNLDSKKLTADEENITNFLFRECKSLEMKELSGGYSGSKVYLINSIDRLGAKETPTVLKLDRAESIGKERMGFEKVQHMLGHHVPKIVDSIETEHGAGIRYSFAMMNKKGGAKTFKDFFVSLDLNKKQDKEKLVKCINILFEEIFEPLYSNWTLDQKQLWQANTYKVEYIGFIANSIKKLLGYSPREELVKINSVGAFHNPMFFYNEANIKAKLKAPVSYVRQALAHGDFNAGNLIIDDAFNMWLIDFFHTDYDYHIIQDIVKLENDLKFIHTPINSTKELLQLIEFEKLLMSQHKLSDLLKPLPKALAKNKNIKKIYLAVKMLREFAYKVSVDDNMDNYRIPQLRYSCHNISFDESSHLQKTYAFISTSMLTKYFSEKK